MNIALDIYSLESNKRRKLLKRVIFRKQKEMRIDFAHLPASKSKSLCNLYGVQCTYTIPLSVTSIVNGHVLFQNKLLEMYYSIVLSYRESTILY